MPGATGSTSGAEIVGLNDFRRELRKLGGQWPQELRRVNAQIARRGAALAQREARSLGGIQARAAGAIVGKANMREARIGVNATRSNPMANVAFWGAKRHTGWYANPRYSGGAPQHPPWVGNTWDVAVRGQGPYAINAALARYLPELVDQFGDMIDHLSRRAWPEP